MAKHAITGLPSDLLNSPKEGARRLKVEATIIDGNATPESGLIQKEFTYNPDGSIDTLTETNLTTLIQVQKQFNYNPDGSLLSIVPSII